MRFCEDCGTSLESACGQCGAGVAPGKTFCGSCGARVVSTSRSPAAPTPPPGVYTPPHLAQRILRSREALEGERKQVTVLFCDIVDSTGLAERLGPEAMHRLLSRFFEMALTEVHRFEGTVNQFLGDGFMALVGVPLTHEDHARRAVLAALAVRERLAEELADAAEHAGTPQVRMGLNTGTVVVASIGDDLQMDYTAIGDTTNVAARLQTLAAPGEILISESTERLVRGYVRLDEIGPMSLRGKREPITVYRVLGPGRRRSPLEGVPARALSRFVGRERQLGVLRELFEQAEEGEGQLVGVVGEPGIGKSRLLYEFSQTLAARKVTYLEGRCLSYGAAIPYLPVIDILRHNCGIEADDDGRTAAERVDEALAEVGMATDEWRAYLLHLLGMREGTESLANLSPEAIKARTFETLRQMSLAGSRRRPIIFVVEDLHWIDSTSEEFFASLAESCSGAAIMLLTTYRPGYRPPWIEHSYATQLPLRQLRADDAMSIVRSVLGEGVTVPLAQVIIERAEGNAFFLEELSRAVAEQGQRPEEAAVPETVQGVLMARIDRLPEAPRRVLQIASVLGREFSLRLLGAVWRGPGALEPHLLDLKRLEFVYERPGAAEQVYVFKHALTQDVAYESLLVARRQALHEAVARAIEELHRERLEEVEDLLAHHWSKTERSTEAVHWLGRFAQSSFRSHSHAEAARALREALRHAERLPAAERDVRVAELTLRAANSLYFLGDLEGTRTLLLNAQSRVEALDEPGLTGPLHFWLAHTYSHLGLDGVDHHARQAILEGERCGDPGTSGRAHMVLSRECMWTGRFLEGIRHGEQAVALLEAAGEDWWLAQSHFYLGMNFLMIGEFDRALATCARGLAIAESIGDPRVQSYGAWNAGWIHATRGDGEEAVAWCTRSLELSPDPLNTAFVNGWIGLAYREQGDQDRAIHHLERAIAEMRRFNYPRLVAWYEGWLSEAHLRRGEIDRARELASDALSLKGGQWSDGIARRALGRAETAAGFLDEAEAQLKRALEAFEPIGARFDAAVTHLDLAEVTLQLGEREAAAAHLAEGRGILAGLPAPRYQERAERLAAADPATRPVAEAGTPAGAGRTAHVRQVVLEDRTRPSSN
jgi:class 3 adenylate cyclase/tetratricopeptide (TPR) repeat protein